jgi:hypothetical protein
MDKKKERKKCNPLTCRPHVHIDNFRLHYNMARKAKKKKKKR